jgi:hypothetical protein
MVKMQGRKQDLRSSAVCSKKILSPVIAPIWIVFVPQPSKYLPRPSFSLLVGAVLGDKD